MRNLFLVFCFTVICHLPFALANDSVSGDLKSGQSCMAIACQNGHCKFDKQQVSNACSDAKDNCVREACRDGSCKFKSDFLQAAAGCKSKQIEY